MEKIPPQVPSLETDDTEVFGLTFTYIKGLVQKIHSGVLHGLDDAEIHDLIVDALLRNAHLGNE